MFRPSPSGGGGSSSLPSSSYPLSYQTVLDHEPRPLKLEVFDEPPYSQLRAFDVPHVVEVSDSSCSESTSALKAEEFATSSTTPIDVARSSWERENTKVRALEGSWSYDEVKSKLTQADLGKLRLEFSIPYQVTLRVPGDEELPSSLCR